MTQNSLSVIIIFLLLSTIGCTKYNEHPKYNLTGKQTGFEIEKYSNGDVFTFSSIKLNLESKQDFLPGFYLMTCSWGDNALINNSEFGYYQECDANFISAAKFDDDQYLELNAIIYSERDYADIADNELRIGLVLVDTTEINWVKMVDHSLQSGDSIFNINEGLNDIVWSNSIQIFAIDKSLQDGNNWSVKNKSM